MRVRHVFKRMMKHDQIPQALNLLHFSPSASDAPVSPVGSVRVDPADYAAKMAKYLYEGAGATSDIKDLLVSGGYARPAHCIQHSESRLESPVRKNVNERCRLVQSAERCKSPKYLDRSTGTLFAKSFDGACIEAVVARLIVVGR
jgi:hypothetical protein